MPESATAELDALLEFLKESRGFDFTGYKRSSIQRRVAKRMAEVGVAGFDEYVDYLQMNREEFAALFNTLLINVTGFFRDAETWEHLATDILPQLLSGRPSDSGLRVWCAGCASGEEAYTVAMVMARVLGDEAFRDGVKIYATDIDEHALDQARHGTYLPRQVEDVPREALERFFQRTDQRYVFNRDLRRCVIFGRNDLVQDAPISHIDLLVCRNTLMYFTAETQSQILRRFHFALEDEGVLLLGKSEMLIRHGDLFTPVDLKRRVFRKVVAPTVRDRIRALATDPLVGATPGPGDSLRDAALDAGATAQMVLDVRGALLMANDVARRTFGLGVTDLGRPIQDLEISYRPVELRSHLDTIAHDPRAIDIKGVRLRSGNRERILDVRLAPLLGDGVVLGTSVTYTDVTEQHAMQQQVVSSRRELEQAYEELQSAVEELETTNEELQSTNEELETTNEELQSSNEELETMNDELRHRSVELGDMNSFLETVLTTMGLAVAVTDRQLGVQIWNGQARELWGLTADEAEERSLLALDFGLPTERLKPMLVALLSGKSQREEVLLDSTNRRGSPFQCRVTCMPLSSGRDGNAPGVSDVTGVIILMEPVSDGAGHP